MPSSPDRHADVAKVVERTQVTSRAHHVFGLRHFQDRTAGLGVRRTHRLDHLLQRNGKGAQATRIDDDLILSVEPADGGDLGHVRHRLKFELEEPVLQRAQFADVVCPAAIDQCVFVDPADAGRIRTQRRRCADRKPRLHLRQILEYARPRPVQIGAVVEQHVHERFAEQRVAAHRLRVRHRQQSRCKRVGDLILDHLRGLARKRGADDHLDVGEIGNGVERRARQRHQSPRDQNRGREQHQQPIGRRPADDGGDHRVAPLLRSSSCMRLYAPRRLASESMRNCPDVTTRSPSSRPDAMTVVPLRSAPTTTCAGR